MVNNLFFLSNSRTNQRKQNILPKCKMYHFKVLFFQLAYNNSLQSGTSLVVQRVKRLPTVWETRIRSLGQDDPLEKEMATHSSTLAWKIPWTEERSWLHTVHGVAKSRTQLSDFTSLHFTSIRDYGNFPLFSL